jgi:hypothetical protein
VFEVLYVIIPHCKAGSMGDLCQNMVQKKFIALSESGCVCQLFEMVELIIFHDHPSGRIHILFQQMYFTIFPVI